MRWSRTLIATRTWPVTPPSHEVSTQAELAALTGATVIATCGPDNEARVRALGASEVLDYHDPTWPDKARYAAAQRDTRYRLWWCLD